MKGITLNARQQCEDLAYQACALDSRTYLSAVRVLHAVRGGTLTPREGLESLTSTLDAANRDERAHPNRERRHRRTDRRRTDHRWPAPPPRRIARHADG